MAFLNGDDANNTVAQKGIRLPKVRAKLSNLVRRKGSTRSKLQLTATTTPRASTDGVLTTTKTGVPIIDVDVTRTRSYRLAEGWLEQEDSKKTPSSPNTRRNGQGGGDSQREPQAEEDRLRYNKTPIAAMFSKSTDQLAGALESISFRKPVPPASASTTILPAGGATGAVSTSASPMKTTKQEVSASKAPPAPASEPTPIRISLQHSLVEEPVAITTPVPQSRGRTVGPSWGIRAVPADPSDDGQRHSIRHVGLLRSVGDNTTGLRVSGGGNGNGNGSSSGGGSAVGDSAKRFSAPSVSSPVPILEPTMKTVLSTVPRSSSLNMPPATPSSLNPDNQRRSWQPAPTSAPSTRTSQDGNGTGTGMPPPPRRTLTSRPPSVALTSSRLSWIRDLENKSSSTSSASSSTSDMQRLKKTGGGVAGKLAMFEQIQKQTQPALPPTISRSNSRASSRSRMSSAAFTDHSGSVFSAAGGAHQLADDGRGRPLSFVSTATGRTSMDSTRESLSVSHRNSGVMAYYDEGFRERMEGVAGGWAKQLQKLTGGRKDKDKDDATKKENDEEVKRESPVSDSDSRADVTAVRSEDAEGEAEWKAPVALPFLADVRAAGDKERPVKDEKKPTTEEEQSSKDDEEPATNEQQVKEEEKPAKEEDQSTKDEDGPVTNEQPAKEEAVAGDKEELANEPLDEEDLAKEQEPVMEEGGLTKDEDIVKDEEPAKDEQQLVNDDEEVSKPEEELVKISTAVEEPQE